MQNPHATQPWKTERKNGERGDSSGLLVLNITRTRTRSGFQGVIARGLRRGRWTEKPPTTSRGHPTITHHEQIRPADHGHHPRIGPKNTRCPRGTAGGSSVFSCQAKPTEDRSRGHVWCHRRIAWKVFVSENAPCKESQLSGARMGQAVELNPVSSPTGLAISQPRG